MTNHNEISEESSDRSKHHETIDGLPEKISFAYSKMIEKNLAPGNHDADGAQERENRENLRLLVLSISQLKYAEYLLLEGLLQRLRNNKINLMDFASAADEVLEKYRSKYPGVNLEQSALEQSIDLLKKFQNMENFPTEALLITRMFFSLGKLVINMDLDENRPLSLNPKENFELKIGQSTYSFVYQQDDRILITCDSTNGTATLRLGKIVILGRDLKLETLFGVPMNQRSIKSDLSPNDDSVSRASIRVIWGPDGIYVFDAGSKNPVKIINENDIITFDPNGENDDGSCGYSWSKPRT